MAADGVAVLVEPAAMDEGLLEEVEVGDREAETLRQLGCRSHHSSPRPSKRL